MDSIDPAAGRVRLQDIELRFGGLIGELVENAVGSVVSRNLGAVKPAAVGEAVEILARIDREVHVRELNAMG